MSLRTGILWSLAGVLVPVCPGVAFAGLAPQSQEEFEQRFTGWTLHTDAPDCDEGDEEGDEVAPVTFIEPGRFEVSGIEFLSVEGDYEYEETGANTGTLTLILDLAPIPQVFALTFNSQTMGAFTVSVFGFEICEGSFEFLESTKDPVTPEPEPEGEESLFVPVLLTSAGRNNALFTSELTLTNRGSEEATLHYAYTANRGGGSGTATDRLAPGRQRIQSDALGYLADLGIPIPDSGDRIGTLRVGVSGSSGVSVVTRTTTAVPAGRAGLAYPGIGGHEGFREAVYLCGLRENNQDRSNVAVQNMGGKGSITLRTTVYSGSPTDPRGTMLADKELGPGEFHQFNAVMAGKGDPLHGGYVKVEKVAGEAPFYAYGVINDNFNSDGSFVFPLTASSLVGSNGQTLPVVIETGAFQSELTLTNFSRVAKTVKFRFVADAVETADLTAGFSLRLKAGEQVILPNLVSWLRREGVAGIGPAERAFVGALFATVAEGDMSGIVMGARTGSPDGRGGQYSLFYNGVAYGAASVESAWIYGLQQNAENRSNLALVNTGEIDDSASTFEITIYDGTGDTEARTRSMTVAARRWTQINGILGDISQGYVQVRKMSGNNPFITYGVINDGGRPGQRSGDGAYLPAQP